MIYLLLSIAFLCTTTASANNSEGIVPAVTTANNDYNQNTTSPIADSAMTKVIVPIEKELSLQKIASIYKKLLHDQDTIKNETFEDESLRSEVEKVIQDRVNTIKNILNTEAPELAANVEEEYAAPKRKLIIIGTVAVLIVGASILALFSYDPTTSTWGKPKLANAKASVVDVFNKFTHAFDAPANATGTVPAIPATTPASV